MKKISHQDLEQKSEAELKTMLKTEKGELAQMILDKNTTKLKNLRSIFHQKKAIARILTMARQKELVNV